jgi:hypothetical protein
VRLATHNQTCAAPVAVIRSFGTGRSWLSHKAVRISAIVDVFRIFIINGSTTRGASIQSSVRAGYDSESY